MSNIKYRPEIDGLRAISVLAVVLFHLGVPGVSGGFAGVDVFFVISGFLITTILKAELDSDSFSLLSFYGRRIRRILPALLVMLLVSLGAGYWLLAPGDYATMGRSAVAAAASVSNIFFYLNTGYFDASASTMPLLHTWSLAIEEQFYVVLPIALAIIYRLRRGRYALTALVCLFSLSFIGGLLALSHNPKAAFYLPQYRAWELAAGSILAFLPVAKTNRSAAAVGLALVLSAVLALDKATAFPGFAALLPVIGACLLLRYGSQPGLIRSALSAPPMIFIGKISYSLYLWHWPVIVLWKHYTGNASLSAQDQIMLGAISFGLGWLSWRWVEQPFRRQRHSEHRTVGAGIGASVLVGMAALTVASTHGFPSRIPADLGNLGNRDAMWAWDCPAVVQDGPWKGLCQAGGPWGQSKMRLVLTGDSHAEHFMPYIHEAAKANGVSVALFRACPPIFTDTGTKRFVRLGPDYTAGCTKTHDQLLAQLAASDDVSGLIIASAWAGHALWSFRGDSPPESIGTPAAKSGGLQALKDGMNELLPELEKLGKRVIVISDMPSFDAAPIHCAIGNRSGLLRRSCGADATKISPATFGMWQAQSQRMLQEVQSRHPEVAFIFPGDAMCTALGCDTYQDGRFLYRDTDHLRRDLGPTVNRHLADRIGLTDALGLIIPPAQ
ncbi:acyltransferase family protein [Achromobacter sp. NPDC058515]|uniref:acyltransferase family protein n=1 Tax=Achromobacter sp. NPDC058515 TaxID=3346533 RepID=UPI00364FE1D0